MPPRAMPQQPVRQPPHQQAEPRLVVPKRGAPAAGGKAAPAREGRCPGRQGRSASSEEEVIHRQIRMTKFEIRMNVQMTNVQMTKRMHAHLFWSFVIGAFDH